MLKMITPYWAIAWNPEPKSPSSQSDFEKFREFFRSHVIENIMAVLF